MSIKLPLLLYHLTIIERVVLIRYNMVEIPSGACLIGGIPNLTFEVILH